MEPARVEISGKITPVILESHGPTISECDIAKFEDRLGYKLPKDYREFLLNYNGGSPVVGDIVGRDDDPDTPYQHGDAINTFLKLSGANVQVADYEALRTPADIGWELPDDILPIADDSGGNCFVLELGARKGVVRFLNHEALDEGITRHRVIADNFLDLLLRVVSVEEKAAADKLRAEAERKTLTMGKFPRKLESQCRAMEASCPRIRQWIRAVCLKLFDLKGYFSVHDDDLSRTLLDLAFWMYQSARGDVVWIKSTELETMILCWWREEEEAFGLTGHAPGFLKDWWDHRLATGALEGTTERARFTKEAAVRLVRHLASMDSNI